MKERFEEALDVQVRYSRFVALLDECVSRATPRLRYGDPTNSRKSASSGSGRSGPPSPWWDSECDKLSRLRRAAFLRFKYTGLREDKMLYKTAEAKAEYGLKRIKKESFRKFAEGLTKYTNRTYTVEKG